jgi:hypothetical protein
VEVHHNALLSIALLAQFTRARPTKSHFAPFLALLCDLPLLFSLRRPPSDLALHEVDDTIDVVAESILQFLMVAAALVGRSAV